jgi:hypothetical protein
MDRVIAPIEITPTTITATAPTRLIRRLFILVDPTLPVVGRSGLGRGRGSFDANAQNSANSRTPWFFEAPPSPEHRGVGTIGQDAFARAPG